MPIPDFILNLRSKIGNDPLWLAGVTVIVLRPLDKPEQVLLVRRSDDGTWTPVKGIVEPEESVAAAARRECLEETKVMIDVDRLVGVNVHGPVHYANGDVSSHLNHTVRAKWISGEPEVGDDESVDTRWFDLDDLPSSLSHHDLSNLRLALANPADVVLEGPAPS